MKNQSRNRSEVKQAGSGNLFETFCYGFGCNLLSFVPASPASDGDTAPTLFSDVPWIPFFVFGIFLVQAGFRRPAQMPTAETGLPVGIVRHGGYKPSLCGHTLRPRGNSWANGANGGLDWRMSKRIWVQYLQI